MGGGGAGVAAVAAGLFGKRADALDAVGAVTAAVCGIEPSVRRVEAADGPPSNRSRPRVAVGRPDRQAYAAV